MRQFKGTDDFAELQRILINSVAQTDINTARSMAEQISDQNTRDAAFSQLITAQAYSDPQEAASWLDSISNDVQRADTLRQLVREWAMNDSAAAQRWVNGLASGVQRDDAIIALASTWEDAMPSQRRLIDSIGDLEKRAQAQMAQISAIAQRDWRKAQTMLAASNLDQTQRLQVQQYIEYFKNEGQ